jgi:hypothetical protein
MKLVLIKRVNSKVLILITIDLIICRHPSLNKIETENVLKARRSLLDIAD